MQNEEKLINKAKNKVKKNLNIDPHPNRIIMIRVNKEMTAAGIYLPPTEEERSMVFEIISTGSNVSDFFQKGDVVYVVPQYVQFVNIERQECGITYEDGIIAKVTRTEKK